MIFLVFSEREFRFSRLPFLLVWLVLEVGFLERACIFEAKFFKMTIELADSVLAKTRVTEQTIKLLFAIFLFKEEILTLGQAAELAELPKPIFQMELGKRKIPIHYDRRGGFSPRPSTFEPCLESA